ncbi:hypothetical protein [Terrilactibacillus laevilacticus]|uniref:Uncharacterized protein n=1 Tax=Terrilactibacillus laevilacticus TaxID=1380157 RepID=A0ABW5PPX4_9BACI
MRTGKTSGRRGFAQSFGDFLKQPLKVDEERFNKDGSLAGKTYDINQEINLTIMTKFYNISL